MPDTPPIGQRFSQVYIKRGEPTQDSQRMRRRLTSLVWDFPDLSEFASAVPLSLGIDVPFGQFGFPDWTSFFQNCDLQDVLDVVTIAYRHLREKQRTRLKQYEPWERWCREVRSIFQEENVHYRVDERGGVHFSFDAEFDRSIAATIAALQASRYKAALSNFGGAMAALGKGPPDCKTAIRATFDAAENLFKLMFSNSPRLTAKEASKLEPLLQKAHAKDGAATGAATSLLSAFKDWIDAAQFYRHEAGKPEPVQPPLTLAVHMVSLGASFLRWLAELDATQQGD